jgi:serine protease Do
MRRFQTLLLVAGLAAPVSAFAGPSDTRAEDHTIEVHEWSIGKGRLGIVLMGLTPELRTHFAAPRTAGVLVARVDADSPAAKAGVRVGDVLTKTNNQSLDDVGDVRAAIATAKKGDMVELTVIRDRKPLSLEVVLADDAPRDWFHDFMKSFDELRKSLHAPKKT